GEAPLAADLLQLERVDAALVAGLAAHGHRRRRAAHRHPLHGHLEGVRVAERVLHRLGAVLAGRPLDPLHRAGGQQVAADLLALAAACRLLEVGDPLGDHASLAAQRVGDVDRLHLRAGGEGERGGGQGEQREADHRPDRLAARLAWAPMTPSPSRTPNASPVPRGRHAPPLEIRLSVQRRRLFEAAAAVFARKGYAASTAEAISREAGMSKATFYEHFANKEECIIALFDEAATEVMRQMSQATSLSKADTYEEYVSLSVRAFLETIA